MVLPVLSSKKIVIIIGLVILVQIAWAGWTLLGPDLKDSTSGSSSQISTKEPGSYATLTASSNEVSLGEQFTVDINIFGTRPTDGADLIIVYDPKLLSVILPTAPVKTGTIYEEYPLNQVDEASGKIYVSGVVSSSTGVVPQGHFGLVTFTSKATGAANIAFDFTPGQSTDTNLVEINSHKDILERVENIQINIK